jgi:Resolvase, N terminal domain
VVGRRRLPEAGGPRQAGVTGGAADFASAPLDHQGNPSCHANPASPRSHSARPTCGSPPTRAGPLTKRTSHSPIEAQESKLDSYAASQEGWTIVAKYSDDASGAKLERPDLARALAAARAGKFDVLLVYRVDRFSRRIRDLVTLLDDLDRSGVVFRSATEPFDTSTSDRRDQLAGP